MRWLASFVSTVVLINLALAGKSNSLIDVSPDGKFLAVANTDSGTVSVVDLKTRKTMAEFPCGDHPEGISWIGETGRFIVTVYGDDCLRVYHREDGYLNTIPVEDEPYGIVTTTDGQFAYVTHDYPALVSEIDLSTMQVRRKLNAGPGARGIAIDGPEKKLFVTEFFTSQLHQIDIATGKIEDSWPGYDSDNLARNVILNPKRAKAYLMHIRSRVTSFNARGSIFPQLSICDLWAKPEGEKRRRSIALDTYNNVYVVTNPWEAAITSDGKKLYTLYAGTDDMNVSAVIDDDYQEVDRIGRAVTVGKHPRAIRLSPDDTEVYIYNTLDYSIGIYTSEMRNLANVKVCEPAHTAEWRRGKELFQTAKSPMGSARWIACSSCHPDGLTDQRVWQNPEGHRKTPNLFGLAHTHPLHWSADRDETQDFEYTIRGKLMQGRGLSRERLKSGPEFTPVALEMKLAGTSKDLDALAIYTNSFPVRLSPHIPAPGKLSPAAQRGQVIFQSQEAQCAKCHTGPYYTDSTLTQPFQLHDVGTGGAETEKMGNKYDTPTLLGAYRIGSYLHDGRAKSLEEVLTTYNKEDKHGKTSHLKPAEIQDLVAFLKSLPFETPPDQTPNSVPDYVKELAIPRPKVVKSKKP